MYTDLIQRLQQIDFLIQQQNTGSPRSFAQKLGLSERSMYDYLSFMRKLNAPIEFSAERQTYYYDKEGEFIISFVPATDS